MSAKVVHADRHGRRVAWVYLDDGDLRAAEALCWVMEQAGQGREHRWTPRADPAKYRRCNALARVAAELYLDGDDLPDGAVVRCTPLAAGRPLPRFEDVHAEILVFARGPFADRDGGRVGPLRWVELCGWLDGAQVEERAGDPVEGGWRLRWSDTAPIGTLRARVAQSIEGEQRGPM